MGLSKYPGPGNGLEALDFATGTPGEGHGYARRTQQTWTDDMVRSGNSLSRLDHGPHAPALQALPGLHGVASGKVVWWQDFSALQRSAVHGLASSQLANGLLTQPPDVAQEALPQASARTSQKS